MEDKIQAVIDSLTALRASIRDLGDTDAKLSAARAMLDATQKEHSKATAALAEKTKLLDTARAQAVVDHDKEMFAKTKELRQLTEQVKSKTVERDTLLADIATARKDHEGIVASLDSLRKRLG
jgi:uncharacterized coiled-coil DUF342 family protein